MATPTDSSFGAGFNADAFRSAITSTMQMGLPTDVNDQATWRRPAERTFTAADPSGQPYDWHDTPTAEVTYDEVQIPCAVEVAPGTADSRSTRLGRFDAVRMEITVLDTYYPQVQDMTEVVIDGAIYDIDFWGPPVGLSTVTVYTAFLHARDEH